MDGLEHILVNVAVAARDQDAALQFHLVLLALDLLLLGVIVLLAVLRHAIHIVHAAALIIVFAVLIRHIGFILVFFVVLNILSLKDDAFQLLQLRALVCKVVFGVKSGVFVRNDFNQLSFSRYLNA